MYNECLKMFRCSLSTHEIDSIEHEVHIFHVLWKNMMTFFVFGKTNHAHDGIRYSCNQCEKEFTTMGNLRRHIEIMHSDQVKK